MLDRDILKRGKKLELVTNKKDIKRKIFRNLFIKHEDEKIARIIWNYFSAIKERWDIAWNNNSIICKSTGIIAFMKFFRFAYIDQVTSIGDVVTTESFREIFLKVQIRNEDFNIDNFIPGAQGQRKLLETLKLHTGLSENTIEQKEVL